MVLNGQSVYSTSWEFFMNNEWTKFQLGKLGVSYMFGFDCAEANAISGKRMLSSMTRQNRRKDGKTPGWCRNTWCSTIITSVRATIPQCIWKFWVGNAGCIWSTSLPHQWLPWLVSRTSSFEFHVESKPESKGYLILENNNHIIGRSMHLVLPMVSWKGWRRSSRWW